MLFTGLIPLEETPQEGKQPKAPGTGRYKSARSKDNYYVKRTDSFPGDDLAEYISSQILTALVGDDVADCRLVLNNSTKEAFLASRLAPGIAHEALKKQNKIAGCWDQVSRDSVYSRLQRRSLQMEFTRTLAACMLIGDYDVHPGNFILYKDSTNKSRVYKMDHGWGLHNIGLSSNDNIMTTKQAFGLYGKWFRFMPTNHFNNYPELIYTEDFLFTIDNILQKYHTHDMKGIIKETIDNIGRLYPRNHTKQIELFSLVATHIGDTRFNSALSGIDNLEQKAAAAKSRLVTFIANGIDNRKNMLLALKREISQRLIDRSVKRPRVHVDDNLSYFASISSTVNEFNDLDNSSLAPIEEQLASMGKSISPTNVIQFLLEYNYLLDQDKVALILCNEDNSKYLTALLSALPLDNHTPAFALSLLLRSGIILIPTDPDRLNNLIEAFTKVYLKKNPNSFLHAFTKKAQIDFFGQTFCLMASNRDNRTTSLNEFYTALDPEFRVYGGKETYSSIYDEAVDNKIDFKFATRTGYLFEKVDFNKERKFVELKNVLSTKSGRENFSKRYSFLPPNCKVHATQMPTWLQYLFGTKWQAKVYSSNQKLICTLNYYQPSGLFKIFGKQEQLQFLPSSEHRHSLDYTAQLARELNMHHQKIFGDEHFSIEQIKRSLNTAHERTKYKQATPLREKSKPQHKSKTPQLKPSKKTKT